MSIVPSHNSYLVASNSSADYKILNRMSGRSEGACSWKLLDSDDSGY